MLARLWRRSSRLQKLLSMLLVFSSLTLLYIGYTANTRASKSGNMVNVQPVPLIRTAKPPVASYTCPRTFLKEFSEQNNFIDATMDNLRTEKRILVLVETQYSMLGRQIVDTLNALKFQYRVEVLGKTLPLLTTVSRGKFALVIFENYYKYLNMDQWNRQLLDKYCQDYNVGLLAFLLSREDKKFKKARVRGFPLEVVQNERPRNLRMNPASKMFRIARYGAGPIERTPLTDDWLLFSSNDQRFVPVLQAFDQNNKTWAPVIEDSGGGNGVKRVLFGYDFRFWMLRMLFVDAVGYLTQNRLILPLTRYVQIDIDDIFVGASGYRMVADDVKALIQGQKLLAAVIPDFKFTMGFSGKFFEHGDALEDQGDRALIASAGEFTWFPHMWKHNHVHLYNETSLDTLMRNNLNYSQLNELPVKAEYAVAPHHAGVYPVHEPLYSVWKKIWGVKVTSTEQYPHFQPASLRRGFLHRDIAVLPRQTCGLFTHTVFLDLYPGGKEKLDQNILGGDLFKSFLLNPFLIFMTHSTNYANDRLALYTFETALRFLSCWTNLQFRSISPTEMAHRYFSAYPQEREPVWGNPCLDKKHLAIWSPRKSCDRLPHALVLGPQKTGTTALYTFLKSHPMIKSNLESSKTYEEIQFFNGRNYRRGIDWYMEFFSVDEEVDLLTNSTEPIKATNTFFFEKSATYFDAELAPKRVKALIPDAKLIIILLSPVKRAYSWYQHAKAHGNLAANTLSFTQVLNSTSSSDGKGDAFSLRQRCLSPGHYAHHIEHWLEHFSSKQLLILDGELLKSHPSAVMRNVQDFLGLDPLIDYEKLLKYDPRKGFFCQVMLAQDNKARTKCLGRGKGRKYPAIEPNDRNWLLNYYKSHNVALQRLLNRLGYSTPAWLQWDLQDIL